MQVDVKINYHLTSIKFWKGIRNSLTHENRALSKHFLSVYRRNNPRGMLGEHEKSFSVNHEPKASDLQAFRVLSQHPKWVIMPVNR